MGVLNTLAGIPLMYGLMSANEYVTHRYYQHNEVGKLEVYQTLRKMDKIPKLDGGGHIEHHAETYDDMSLKTDNPVWMASAPAQRMVGNKYRGTAFTWGVTRDMCLQCIPTVFPAFALLGWSVPATLALWLPSMILHGLVWNALHPNMHGLPDVPLKTACLRRLSRGCAEAQYLSTSVSITLGTTWQAARSITMSAAQGWITSWEPTCLLRTGLRWCASARSRKWKERSPAARCKSFLNLATATPDPRTGAVSRICIPKR